MDESAGKFCRGCSRHLPLKEYYKQSDKADGLTTRCKSCIITRVIARERKLKARKVLPTRRGSKTCRDCKQKLPIAQFSRSKRQLDGYSPHCKRCDKSLWMTRYYGIDLRDKEKLLIDQKNQCAICKTPLFSNKEAHVDHLHGTKFVRGILCHRCNTGIGLFKDNPETLQAAILYLRKSVKARKKIE